MKKKPSREVTSKAGADFVKTSTGFAGGGATVDVELMRKAVGADGREGVGRSPHV
ncbi:MAG: hypothetical protein U0X93_03815 [Anaerolineales bacterium]